MISTNIIITQKYCMKRQRGVSKELEQTNKVDLEFSCMAAIPTYVCSKRTTGNNAEYFSTTFAVLNLKNDLGTQMKNIQCSKPLCLFFIPFLETSFYFNMNMDLLFYFYFVKKYHYQMGKRIISVLLSIIIICLILNAAEARRGPSSGPRSDSRTSSSKFGKLPWYINWKSMIFSGCLLFGIAYYGHVSDLSKRTAQINEIMKEFEGLVAEYPSKMTEKLKTQQINLLSNCAFAMNVNFNDDSQPFICDVQVTQLKKQTDNKYSITLSGNDKFGASTLTGVLIFAGDNGFVIKLTKLYHDLQKANQKDSDILIFQGECSVDKLQGTWAFYGKQQVGKFSGKWYGNDKMI